MEQFKEMPDNIDVFTQNSIRIRSDLGVIYVDPFHMKEVLIYT